MRARRSRNKNRRWTAVAVALASLGLVTLVTTVAVACLAQMAGDNYGAHRGPFWTTPKAPLATLCKFGMTLHPAPFPVREDKLEGPPDGVEEDAGSRGMVALKGMQIWGKQIAFDWTYDDDDSDVATDSLAVGQEVSYIIYGSNPSAACVARYSAAFNPSWKAVAVGEGNVESEVEGLMFGQMADITFPRPSVYGLMKSQAGERNQTGSSGSTSTTAQFQLGWTQKDGAEAKAVIGRTITTHRYAAPVVPEQTTVFASCNAMTGYQIFTQDVLTICSRLSTYLYCESPGSEDHPDEDVRAACIYTGALESNPAYEVWFCCRAKNGDPTSPCNAETKSIYSMTGG